MAKILYAPFSILGGLLAGLFARKLFNRAWALVDDEADGPPKPGERDAPVAKVIGGAVLQAGVFAGVKALFDRFARRAFYGLFGAWPGDERGA